MEATMNPLSQRLIDGLRQLHSSYPNLPLVPLNDNKQPLGDGWPNRPFSATALITAIENGGVEVPIQGKIKKIQPQGFGLLTGRPLTLNGTTYYLMALDQDGASAADKILELSGGEPLPKTVAFTSGRPGRCQYLFLVPEEYKDAIRTKKIKTGVKGDDGKGEQVEFRGSNLQSVLPPSVHPTTGQYHWVSGCAIDETEIALAPTWLIAQMLVEPKLRQGDKETGRLEDGGNFFKPLTPSQQPWTDIDLALSYLNALGSYRADDYDEWLTVGMALHSVSDSLLAEWDSWSQQSAKYQPGDCQKKWKSFSLNGGVTLGTLAHKAKQDGWRFPSSQRTLVATAAASSSQETQTVSSLPNKRPPLGGHSQETQVNGNGHPNNGKTPRPFEKTDRIDEISMRSHLWQLLNQHLSPPEQTEAFNLLARATGWNIREIRALAREIEADLDLQDSRPERHSQLQELETHKQRRLNLYRFLPAAIADPMTNMARWMETPTAALLTGLLPTFASCLHPATRVIVKEAIGFIEAPIIYAGIVTESGQRKSPIMNAILDPLCDLQQEEEERYKQEKASYDLAYELWQADKDSMPKEEWKANEPTLPTPVREFYLDKATIEAIDKIKSSQPDTSLLWKKDELSGLLNSYNAYKGGRGEDKESILTGWNGRGVKKNLKSGERVSLKQDSMSIFGSIQDTTLQKKMGNFDDEQGEWGRFLWCLIPLKALRLPADDTSFQLAFLKSLYEAARSLKPQNYRLALDAQALYDDYHWQLEQRRVAHPRKGMRAAIAKMEGYTARLALVLHLIWELEAGNYFPSPYIPRARVEAAIYLTEFYLSQVTLIHADGAAALGEGGLTPRLSAILNKLQQLGELTARKLQGAISWLRQESPSKIRQDLIELAKMGYGQLVGQGNRLKLVLTADSVDKSADTTVDSLRHSQRFDLTESEPSFPTTVDTADTTKTSPNRPPKIPNPKCLEDPWDDYQHYQHNNSLTSTLEPVSFLAADSPSAIQSTVATVQPTATASIAQNDNIVNSSQALSQAENQLNRPAVVAQEENPGNPPDVAVKEEMPINPDVATQEETLGTSIDVAAVEETIGWLLQLLADLEATPVPHPRFTSNEQLLALFDEASQRLVAVSGQLESLCPDYTKRLFAALDVVSLILPDLDPQESPETPTLAQLQALLLACQTLAALNQLKQTHSPERIQQAYEALSFEQQLQIDGLEASAVSRARRRIN
jgi:hypothetical protein